MKRTPGDLLSSNAGAGAQAGMMLTSIGSIDYKTLPDLKQNETLVEIFLRQSPVTAI